MESQRACATADKRVVRSYVVLRAPLPTLRAVPNPDRALCPKPRQKRLAETTIGLGFLLAPQRLPSSVSRAVQLCLICPVSCRLKLRGSFGETACRGVPAWRRWSRRGTGTLGSTGCGVDRRGTRGVLGRLHLLYVFDARQRAGGRRIARRCGRPFRFRFDPPQAGRPGHRRRWRGHRRRGHAGQRPHAGGEPWSISWKSGN